MIPRQDDEPEPRSDKWSMRDRAYWSGSKAHLYAGAWPEVSDLADVVDQYAAHALHQAWCSGFTYNGLGAATHAPIYDAMSERARVKRAKTNAVQLHLRRQARLAQLIRSL